MKRFVITHINRDGLRQLTGAQQARNTSLTFAAATDRLRSILDNNNDAALSLYSPHFRETAEVREVECYESGDPKHIYFDTITPEEMAQAKAKEAPPELTYDGFGVNGPLPFRDRVVTFRKDEDRARYGRLFAAAPALLAALQWAVDQIDDDLDPDHQAALAAAKAAIAQAQPH